MNWVSMRVVADRDLPNSPDGWPRHQRAESFIRRDGDRLDAAQRYLFPDSPEFNKARSHRWRAVIAKESGVLYYAGIELPVVANGIVNNDWAGWFNRHGINETTGGPLDGYFPSTGSRRIAEIMADAPGLRLRGSETIGDTPCKVVEAQTRRGTYVMWIAEAKGFLPLKVTSAIRPEDLVGYRDGLPFSEIAVSTPDGKSHAGLSAFIVLEDVAVAQIGDTFVPVAGKFTRNETYTDLRMLVVNTYERSEIQLNPRFDGTDAFVTDLPDGSSLYNEADKTSGVKYEWRGGKAVPGGTEFSGSPAVSSWESNSAVVPFLWAMAGIALFSGGLGMAFSGQKPDPEAGPQPKIGTALSSQQQSHCAASHLVIGLGAGLLTLFSSVAGASEPSFEEELEVGLPAVRSSQPISYCGVQSLYRALRALGKEVSFADLVKPEYISSKKGSSISDLKRAGEDLGVFVEPMSKMTCGMLRHVRVPVILHVKSELGAKDYNHWVLFMGIEGGRAKIYDGEQPWTEMDFEELAARWDGTGLLVSNSPVRTIGIRLIGIATLLFYAGLVAFVVGILFRIERRWKSEIKQPSWVTSVRSSVGQAVGLLLLALGAMVAYRAGSETGFLSNPAAIATIQNSNLGTFLPKVKVKEMARLLDTPGVAIVDARFPSDFNAGHLKGAINIPVDSSQGECQEALAAVPRDSRIVVYSHSNGCAFGDKVAQELISLGYHNILLYRGGWIDWEKHHPLISKSGKLVKGNQG